MNKLCASLAFAALSGPVPAIAQEEAAGDIVVSGSRMSPEEVRRRANAFVRETGVANGQKPLARWRDPVCPRAIGIGAKEARIVEDKVRAIATAAGAPVARAGCSMNIAISFTRDAGAVVRDVAKRSPRELEEVPSNARRELLEGVAPVRWWYLSDTRTKDGTRGETSELPAATGAEGGGSVLPSGVPTLSHYNSSMISTRTTRVLTSATVLIDADRMDGRRLDEVAAYAAFVALAEIRPAEAEFEGSILGLFQSETPPVSLTDLDLAFLRGLYRLPLDRNGRRHRNMLVGKLVEAAGKP